MVRSQEPTGSPQTQVKDAAATWEHEQFLNLLFSPKLMMSAEPLPLSLRHQKGSPNNMIDKVGLAGSVKSPARTKRGRWAAEK